MITNIIQFEDGAFFNGVKGNTIRKTTHIKDAKIFKTLNDRDKRYLIKRNYCILKVEFSYDILDCIDIKVGG